MQRGGKLLGEGSFGCAFQPAPACADGRKLAHDEIGKIVLKGEEADEELRSGRTIMAISSDSAKYFALPQNSCIPAMPIQDEDVSDCEVIQDSKRSQSKRSEGSPYTMLIMPNAGKTLHAWSHQYPLVADTFLHVFKHLLEGMVIYQDAGYVHNDIKDNNILVDKENVARYIDFGLAYKVAAVTTMESANLGTTFKPKYGYHAPEIHVWRLFYSNSRASSKNPIKIPLIIDEGVKKIKEYNSHYAQLEHAFPNRDSATEALTAFAFATKASWAVDDFGSVVRKYGNRFDSWRLGITMWQIWYALLKWHGFNGHRIHAKAHHVRTLLSGLTDFDVEKRWDARKALAFIKNPQNPAVAE